MEDAKGAERTDSIRLAAWTFVILALELAIIRWTASQVRVFAYFANLVLIGAFLGMGLGVAWGRKKPHWDRYTLPWLTLVAAVLTFSEKLGLMRFHFPESAVSLWGSNANETSLPQFLLATIIVLALFWMVAGIFFFAGVPVGCLFDRLPPLKAYGVDLAGSLLGVVAMTALAALGTPPWAWLLMGVVPVCVLLKDVRQLIPAAIIVALGAYSVQGAVFSPYNRIDLEPVENSPEVYLSVNRDFHQVMLDLSHENKRESESLKLLKAVYELPFRTHKKGGEVLVVGAGTGNDVAAASRYDFTKITAVEIDPGILKLGKKMHPEKPYDDARVSIVNNDARAFFEQNPDAKFDVLCFGLLDSHAMFSAMSSLRLDNYVYTVEGLQTAWSRVKPGGTMALSFYVGNAQWLTQRLFNLLYRATGVKPVIISYGNGAGASFLVGKDLNLSDLDPLLGKPITNAQYNDYVPTPTDDWPFLYLKPNTFPYSYLAVVLGILLTASIAIRLVYGPELFKKGNFDLPLFCMGAGFMLLETRIVTALSLLFGSTWLVNASVFAGVLLLVMVANYAVMRPNFKPGVIWYLPLLISIVATTLIPVGMLNQLDMGIRLIVGGFLFAVPVGFAGIIFSRRLEKAENTSAAFGSNLAGAVLGGVTEYSSMFLGLKAVGFLAAGFYILAWWLGGEKR